MDSRDTSVFDLLPSRQLTVSPGDPPRYVRSGDRTLRSNRRGLRTRLATRAHRTPDGTPSQGPFRIVDRASELPTHRKRESPCEVEPSFCYDYPVVATLSYLLPPPFLLFWYHLLLLFLVSSRDTRPGSTLLALADGTRVSSPLSPYLPSVLRHPDKETELGSVVREFREWGVKISVFGYTFITLHRLNLESWKKNYERGKKETSGVLRMFVSIYFLILRRYLGFCRGLVTAKLWGLSATDVVSILPCVPLDRSGSSSLLMVGSDRLRWLRERDVRRLAYWQDRMTWLGVFRVTRVFDD